MMPLLEGCRVLIVEDEYFLAEDLLMSLRRQGANVVGPIAKLADAVEQVGHGGFDVAVLDINLHDQSTYVIADKLQQAAVPFMFTTGYSAEVLPNRFAHVIRLEKPYNMEQLEQNVSRLCAAVGA